MIRHAVSDPTSNVTGRDADELLTASSADGRRGPDRLLDIMLRTGPYGDAYGAVPGGLSVDELLAHPHGIDFGALQPRLPEALRTPSGRIELCPQPLVDDCVRLAATLTAGTPAFVLVGRRDLRSNNSWMHNINVLVKGKERCTLHVHPSDAERIGLADGASAVVTSRVGSVTVPAEVTDAIRVGVVSLPHGWGHDLAGTSMAVAEARPGVNSNVLADTDAFDPLSGNAVLNGIPVTIEPVSRGL
jgi:anaerobic selenocysteine-containing dehydrogenase